MYIYMEYLVWLLQTMRGVFICSRIVYVQVLRVWAIDLHAKPPGAKFWILGQLEESEIRLGERLPEHGNTPFSTTVQELKEGNTNRW